MRIDRVACLCALVSLPSVTVAQTSHTPLPAAPKVEPLYPSQNASRPAARS